jgi:hypothetical protein
MVFIDHVALSCHTGRWYGVERKDGRCILCFQSFSVQNKDKSGGLEIKLTSLVRWYWCLVIRI